MTSEVVLCFHPDEMHDFFFKFLVYFHTQKNRNAASLSPQQCNNKKDKEMHLKFPLKNYKDMKIPKRKTFIN